jgi:hypothetical protein
MNSCRSCSAESLTVLVDFGPQPLCNRFLQRAEDVEYRHILSLGICDHCGVVQQLSPAPVEEIRPRFEWITYNEPEGHLDRLAGILSVLPGITPQSVFGGITFKDDSTLTRLNRLGFQRTWRLDPIVDLGITSPGSGLETIQDFLSVESARAFANRHGKCNVLLARHILEHVHDIHRFIGVLKELIHPDGRVLFEIPDCSRAIEKKDFSTVWEEHIFYFTPQTYRYTLTHMGLDIVHFENVFYSLENALVAIGRFGTKRVPPLLGEILQKEKDRAVDFVDGLEGQKKRWRAYLSEQSQWRWPVAFLGAGHLSCTFTNLLGLKDHIDFFVDDNVNKQNLFLPGCHRPIYDSSTLLKRNVKTCLMSVSPENEPIVIAKNHRYIESGGSFVSIFPDSPYAPEKDASHA